MYRRLQHRDGSSALCRQGVLPRLDKDDKVQVKPQNRRTHKAAIVGEFKAQ